MAWDIGLSDNFDVWFTGLDDSEQEAIVVAVNRLKEVDDNLDAAPFVGRVRGSRRCDVRELRVDGSDLTVRFTFDRRRQVIELHAGGASG